MTDHAGPEQSTWLQMILPVVISAVTGFVAAITLSFRAAWNLSNQLTEAKADLTQLITDLRLHTDASDSKRFHDMIGILHNEVAKNEAADSELGRRIGACEQDIAVLMDRIKRKDQ